MINIGWLQQLSRGTSRRVGGTETFFSFLTFGEAFYEIQPNTIASIR